jgi:hypothetical protein
VFAQKELQLQRLLLRRQNDPTLLLVVLLSSLGNAVDPGSPPARVGFSVSLVLSIVTFNLVVSQDLPKINLATLLDWYVWCCFMFVVLALTEYAAVHSLVSPQRSVLHAPVNRQRGEPGVDGGEAAPV